MTTSQVRSIAGKVVRRNAVAIEIIFKVAGKEYPADEYNSELVETYLHTGDAFYLDKLENELEG